MAKTVLSATQKELNEALQVCDDTWSYLTHVLQICQTMYDYNINFIIISNYNTIIIIVQL